MAGPLEPRRPQAPTTGQDLRQFRDELQATLAARRELDPEMEDTLVTNFLQQIERAIDARVDARVAEVTRTQGKQQAARTGQVAASMALSIPLLAIAGGIAGLPGIVLVLIMIVVINMVGFIKP